MKKIIAICFLSFFTFFAQAQTGPTYNSTADARVWGSGSFGKGDNSATDICAILELGKPGTDKGILLPRVADTAVVTSPKYGLLVYVPVDKAIAFHDGSAWHYLVKGKAVDSAYRSNDTLYFRQTTGELLPVLLPYISQVAISLPSAIFENGDPVTGPGSGTLFGFLRPQFGSAGAGTVFASPSGGGTGTPSFRLLGAADISYGTLPIVRGGTGLSALGTAGQMIRVNSSNTALEYFDGSTIDTVGTVFDMEMFIGPGNVLFVTDPYRGGFFVKKPTGAANDITIFAAADGNYWHRVYDAATGILVDWAGADPGGVTNSGPAFAAAIAAGNYITCRPGATYLVDGADSILIQGKQHFIFDGKGATIKEGTSYYSTLYVNRCYDVVLKDLRFDGVEDYTYFLANQPATTRQYVHVDSSEYVTVKGIFGQNKRSVVAASSSSYVNIDGVNYEGIFKGGVASNVLAVTAVRVTGYGFVPTLSKYLGFGSISNVYAHNTGAVVLLGDNATYWDIGSCSADTTYNNGIYVSSALWASIHDNTFRKVGGTGIKARGIGLSVTGNVITNADLGIVVTGNNVESFYAPIPTKYGSNGYSLTVSNNIVDTISTRGIDVDFQDGRAVHGVIIAYNHVRNNASTSDYLLKVNVTGGSKVVGNTLQGSLAPIAAYFQRATGDSTQYNIIESNTFRDCAGQGLHIQGLKRSRVSGNVFDTLGGAALVFDNSTGNKINDNIYKAGTVVHATTANGNSDNYIEGNTGAITADNLTSTLLNNYPNLQQNITGTPRLLGQTAISGGNVYVANGTTSSANWMQLTPASRTISTTAPLSGGGDLTANRTISMTQANGSTNGWLSSADWTTFNNKAAGSGDADYIQNRTTPQTADMNISGTGSFNIVKGNQVSSTNFLVDWPFLMAGVLNAWQIKSNNTNKWDIGIRDTETGSGNLGANIFFRNHDDAGAILGIPLYINRATGFVGLGYVGTGQPPTPTSSLDIKGSFATDITTVTGNTTLDATHKTVLVNNTGTAIITLPSAVGIKGRTYEIKKISAASNDVDIPNVDGRTITLTIQDSAITVKSDGTSWWAIGLFVNTIIL